MSFRDALLAIHRLRDARLISEYAIGGAIAVAFWSEPVPTFDLDVFAIFPTSVARLVSLEPLYAWASQQGYPTESEHIIMGGIPVQLIPVHNALAEEAVAEAVKLEIENVAVRVMRPEHLIALYLEPSARTHKRLERVAALLEEGGIDRPLLDAILKRYGLTLP